MATPNTPSPRVAALDNLRVVAMLLGLVVHGVLPYAATGVTRFPIRDRSRHALADACYFAVHDFRMQLFFLLAGFAAAALASRRGVEGLVRNRLARVGLPLALAAVVICPCMHLLFAAHTTSRGVPWDPANCGGWVGPNFHLWFLYYLLLCCIPLVAVLAVRHRVPAGLKRAVDGFGRRFLAWRWHIPVLAAVGIPVLWNMAAWWIDTPIGWVPNLTVLAYYLGFFFAGVVLFRNRDLLPGVGRRWRLKLAAANLVVLPLMLKLTISGNWAEDEVRGEVPAWLVGWKAAAIFLGGLYTWLTVHGLLGLFQRYFATTGPVWGYLAGASYWCYLAGFPIQVALQVWLAPHRLPILAEFVLVNVVTFAVLLVTYEWGVRHTWVGAMLNGTRPRPEPRPTPVVIATRLGIPEPVCVGRGVYEREVTRTPPYSGGAPARGPFPRLAQKVFTWK